MGHTRETKSATAEPPGSWFSPLLGKAEHLLHEILALPGSYQEIPNTTVLTLKLWAVSSGFLLPVFLHPSCLSSHPLPPGQPNTSS